MNNNTGRKRVRRARKNNASIKRILLTVCMMAMIAALSIGGTLAWLTDNTEAVVNQFTPTDIGVEIDENTKKYVMIPGIDIEKDPYVTVEANSVASYVFVKIDKSANYDSYMEDYAVADGWTRLGGELAEDAIHGATEVYYREFAATISASDPAYILAGNDTMANGYVTVKETVTTAMMDSLTTEDAYPTLSFTAYIIQKDVIADKIAADTLIMDEVYTLAQPVQSGN